jgi:hypothetical protein
MKTMAEDDYGLTVNVVDCLRPHLYVYAGELERALLGYRRGSSEDYEADDNSSDLQEFRSRD